ncbi:MAG: VWA domain-containing protein [Gracilibacteraceae bacterium]|nr:VWA domain-containing protein [Gracilibacteraceae bacterium]
MRKPTAVILLLLCALAAMTPAPLEAAQTGSLAPNASGTLNHYNYALVLDGSGSLTLGQQGLPPSDSAGNRYAAVQTLFGLMTEQGDTVNAIVFNDGLVLHTGMQTINSQADKDALLAQIRQAPVRGSTDIGGALLTAVQDLVAGRQQNGLPGVVILFTDGVTDLSTRDQTNRSLADRDEAVRLARENGIKILGIYLNQGGAGAVGEVFNVVRDANGLSGTYDPAQDNNLENHYAEITDAADLSRAQANFRALLAGSGGVIDESLDGNGELTRQFFIPAVGVSEVNIYIDSRVSSISQTLTRPSGERLDESALSGAVTRAGAQTITKLTQPDPGLWSVTLRGDPNAQISYSIIYNLDINAELVIENIVNGGVDGEEARFRAYLSKNGAPLTDQSQYDGYEVTLKYTDQAAQTEESEPMRPSAGAYTATLTLPLYHEYTGYAEFTLAGNVGGAAIVTMRGGFTIKTPTLAWQTRNAPPQALQPSLTVDIPITFFQQGSQTLDLNDYFRDDAPLVYSIETQNYPPGALTLNGAQLTIDGKTGGEGSFAARATDDENQSADMTIEVRCPNRTLPIVLGFLALLLIIGGVLYFLLGGRRIGGKLKLDVEYNHTTLLRGESVMFIVLKSRTRLNESYDLLQALRHMQNDLKNGYNGAEKANALGAALARHEDELSRHIFSAVNKKGDELDYSKANGIVQRLKNNGETVAECGGDGDLLTVAVTFCFSDKDDKADADGWDDAQPRKKTRADNDGWGD